MEAAGEIADRGVDHPEPVPKGLIRILERSSTDMAKTKSGLLHALPTLQVAWHSRDWAIDLRVATRIADNHRPAAANTIRATGFFIREHPFELRDCRLMDWLGPFARHDGPSN